jgi:hypothetical protein
MPRRSAGARPTSLLELHRKRIGFRTGERAPSRSRDEEIAMPDIEGARERLRAENAELRARAVELMLQIRALREG